MANTETLTIATEGGRRFDAYLARPAADRAPGVLVLSDMFGLNEPIRAVADHYAQRGMRRWCRTCSGARTIPGAISYDDPQHATAWARLKALDLDVVSQDMRAASDWLRAQPFGNGKVAAIGFLRRRALRLSRRGALRRRRRGFALWSRHFGASRRDRQCAMPAATALRAEGPAHPASRRSTRSRPACAGRPTGRGVPLSGGRPLVRQSGAADLRSRRGQARRRADRGDAEKLFEGDAISASPATGRCGRSPFRPPSRCRAARPG